MFAVRLLSILGLAARVAKKFDAFYPARTNPSTASWSTCWFT